MKKLKKFKNETAQEEAATFLTPGSIWLRENGTSNTMLFISNLTLPKKVAEVYPPQVVYMDEDGEIFNRPIDEFLATRTFHSIAPEVETLVEKLQAFFNTQGVEADADESDDSEDLIELDEDGDEDDDTTALLLADDEEAKDESDDDAADDEESSLVAFDCPPALEYARSELEAAIVSYRQEPLMVQDESQIAHVLVFNLNKLNMSARELIALFDPDSPQIIPSFQPRGLDVVEWETYLGAYTQMNLSAVAVAIYLGVSAMAVASTGNGAAHDAEIAAIEKTLVQEPAAVNAAHSVQEVAVVIPEQPVPAVAAPSAPVAAPQTVQAAAQAAPGVVGIAPSSAGVIVS